MARRVGESILFEGVGISAHACSGGMLEAKTALKGMFDHLDGDDRFGQENFELAESAMQGLTLENLFQKAGKTPEDYDVLLGGDLTNQCIATGYGVAHFKRPTLGLYSACSTVTEALLFGGMMVDGGAAQRAACVVSSHFCTAERQYRFPLQYGAVRTPTSQRTATACGAFSLEKAEGCPKLCGGRIGIIEDKGVTDANNMGAAMAYAAYSTISGFLTDMNKKPKDFDAIVTGDLGAVGSEMLFELFDRDDLDIRHVHIDCGKTLYAGMDNVNSGGSGAGCSAAVVSGYILPRIESGSLKNVIFSATGALLSQTSVQQQRSIPCVSHLVWIEGAK